MGRTIIALNGFMGLPSDWDVLDLEFLKPWFLRTGDHSLNNWALELNKYAATFSDKPILMGYSLGGRRALHAITHSPDLWKGAIIISAHPGLESSLEKEQRRLDDAVWADKIENKPWDILMKEWNSRGVFKGGCAFDRQEGHYDRKQLAQELLQSSLGTQKDLSKEIANIPIPILWIIGEADVKYSALADKLKFSHPLSSVVKVKAAGHRVCWDQVEICREVIWHFLQLHGENVA